MSSGDRWLDKSDPPVTTHPCPIEPKRRWSPKALGSFQKFHFCGGTKAECANRSSGRTYKTIVFRLSVELPCSVDFCAHQAAYPVSGEAPHLMTILEGLFPHSKTLGLQVPSKKVFGAGLEGPNTFKGGTTGALGQMNTMPKRSMGRPIWPT